MHQSNLVLPPGFIRPGIAIVVVIVAAGLGGRLARRVEKAPRTALSQASSVGDPKNLDFGDDSRSRRRKANSSKCV